MAGLSLQTLGDRLPKTSLDIPAFRFLKLVIPFGNILLVIATETREINVQPCTARLVSAVWPVVPD
jgi:hypothetical protein